MGEEEREVRAKVIISPIALRQLEELPARIGEGILEWLNLLALFPLSGAPMPQDELNAFRRILVNPYMVVYEYDPRLRAVNVLWIQHGRRLPPVLEQLERARDG